MYMKAVSRLKCGCKGGDDTVKITGNLVCSHQGEIMLFASFEVGSTTALGITKEIHIYQIHY